MSITTSDSYAMRQMIDVTVDAPPPTRVLVLTNLLCSRCVRQQKKKLEGSSLGLDSRQLIYDWIRIMDFGQVAAMPSTGLTT